MGPRDGPGAHTATRPVRAPTTLVISGSTNTLRVPTIPIGHSGRSRSLVPAEANRSGYVDQRMAWFRSRAAANVVNTPPDRTFAEIERRKDSSSAPILHLISSNGPSRKPSILPTRTRGSRMSVPCGHFFAPSHK